MEDQGYPPVDMPVAAVARYAYADKYHCADTFPEAVRRIVGVEPKRETTQLHDFVSPALPTILNLTPIGLGVGGSKDRTGNALDVLSIDGHVVLFGSNQAQNPIEHMRVAILQWNEDQSENPLDITTPILQDAAFPQGTYNYELKDSFAVLWDCYVSVSNDPASPHFIQTLPVSLDLSGCPPVLFDGNVFKKGHMYLVCYNAHFAEPSVPPNIEVALTVLFSDT